MDHLRTSGNFYFRSVNTDPIAGYCRVSHLTKTQQNMVNRMVRETRTTAKRELNQRSLFREAKTSSRPNGFSRAGFGLGDRQWNKG